MNLTLYTISAFIIMDSEGHRVLAKYYRPKSAEALAPLGAKASSLTTLKDQKAFEKGLWGKTKKAGGDIILYQDHLAVYRHSLDLIIYFVASPAENELMLSTALNSLVDAFNLLLRGQLEKRAVLENLDLILLCLDEAVDDGIILDTDSTALASRVSRSKADTTEIVINEQTVMNALQIMGERVRGQIARGL
ncbi:Longin-like domain-containing protein [Schizophyllum commune]|uniref:Coatomer subunit zeta n=1 Tax=Schizophyllum commune (strain H4-8 / FGSC 9210) TaxID=578458 RepID=D8QAH5_SCHCM|nr:snare-like protein [Schizophyllum commune H4-8]XP_003030308.1 snare-like protein [Schizophyllum commune H4-8]XP_003030310.1 snare-like protein [Schizophyllum commune H4-8]KAI4518107.1 snare-like protein [Schizophyllum commune Loenen D]KAI5836558.1 snare-like protein [Schizophyllum commune H4-8]KAI5889989.1 snare-like protein [Schizophyllum commune H4-8]KAI5889996.1 snare-like protein [Schizophyllum commune H4-8]